MVLCTAVYEIVRSKLKLKLFEHFRKILQYEYQLKSGYPFSSRPCVQ